MELGLGGEWEARSMGILWLGGLWGGLGGMRAQGPSADGLALESGWAGQWVVWTAGKGRAGASGHGVGMRRLLLPRAPDSDGLEEDVEF